MNNWSIAVEGVLVDARGSGPGWLMSENGHVTGMGHGDCPVEPDVRGTILTDVVNMHTHCADYGLEVPPGLSLLDLVAPPDGLKHCHLRESPRDAIMDDMRRFGRDSRSYGATTFVDFREGGVEGCRMLRSACPEAVILGRPISSVFDPQEIEDILSVADGIGLPSISDIDLDYVEQVADIVREKRSIFAIHVSERIREDIDFVLSLDPAFVVHMCAATDDDLAKCAESEVPVVVCPTSNLYFGMEPPIARAQMNGVDLAIGTDNGMLCAPDPVGEADVFSRIASRQGGDPGESLCALTRLCTKILKSDQTHPVNMSGCPVTVLPYPGVPGMVCDDGNSPIHLEQ